MEPKRTLHSGNLVRGDRKLFILLKDGVHKIDGGSLYWQEESFQILKVEDKEENFSLMEKESHNTIKNSMEQLKQ